MIGTGKGKGGEGFVLGALLGIIGWIIVAIIKGTPEHEAERQRQVNAAMGVPTGPTVAAQWAKDPFGRYGHRYWDGTKWTDKVANNGEESTDVPTMNNLAGADHGWADDPFGRYAKREYREWKWTDRVANSPDKVEIDPPGFPAPIPPPPTD